MTDTPSPKPKDSTMTPVLPDGIPETIDGFETGATVAPNTPVLPDEGLAERVLCESCMSYTYSDPCHDCGNPLDGPDEGLDVAKLLEGTTPGGWSASVEERTFASSGHWFVVLDEEENGLGEFYGPDTETNAANLRLAAAAPQLAREHIALTTQLAERDATIAELRAELDMERDHRGDL